MKEHEKEESKKEDEFKIGKNKENVSDFDMLEEYNKHHK